MNFITQDEFAIRKAWRNDSDFIESYWIDRITNQLRFIIKNEKRILQIRNKVRVRFSKPVWRNDVGEIYEDYKYIWLDVPLEEE